MASLATNYGATSARPELTRRRPKQRRGSPDLSYRRRLDSRRPPGRSPCSPISKGAGGWWRGRWSSPEVRSRRRRSSGECGVDSMVHGRRGWWALRAPGSSLSTAVCSDSSCGGSSHAGDEARRRRASGTAALALGNVRSDGKKGRTAEELTAVPQGWSVGSGMSCRRRIERRRLPAVAMKMAVMAWLQGTRRRMHRGRASWGRDGAPELIGRARGGWWLWMRRRRPPVALGGAPNRGRERARASREKG